MAPTRPELEAAIKSGVVVFDTNVLLNLYRFAPIARSELLEAFQKIGDRIFVPHQVGLEFHRNRLEVISDNRAAYRVAMDSIASHESDVVKELTDKIRQLSNRIALPESERSRLLGAASEIFLPLTQALDEMRTRHGLDDPLADDEILDQLQTILSGRVGAPFDAEEESAALAEAERRNKEKIPPGYKDAPKFGDYFVWRQTLNEVAARGAKRLIFVTGDVKEDWYLRVQGKSLCARPELAEEAFRVAGARLVLMRTETFLRHASAFLDADVSADTIRQVEELPESDFVNAVIKASGDLSNLRAQLAVVERELAVIEGRVVDSHDEYMELRAAIAASSGSSEVEREQLMEAANHLQRSIRTARDLQASLIDHRSRLTAQVAESESRLTQMSRLNFRHKLGEG
ncbi:PIN-like domain-containing protein [Micromonospora chaiyaphumensis]|uniref:PIN-like domain-containing protein n=1 Tax=Micromonospora chaiyaphumensis TaxID=307119 RepID=UPI001113134B|nr:PIN-like domain-containing protein [Micromonospora chaiyaphumensis]